jgi:hypothetical protein
MSSIPGQVKKQIGCVPLSMQHLEVRRQTGWLRVRIICQSGATSPVCSSITTHRMICQSGAKSPVCSSITTHRMICQSGAKSPVCSSITNHRMICQSGAKSPVCSSITTHRIICQSGAKSPVCSSITKQTLSSSHQVTCSQHDIDEKKWLGASFRRKPARFF